MPASASCTISEMRPSVAWDWVVTFFSFLPMRMMGRIVTGTATKAMRDRRQSRTKQFTSMTTTVSPSRR
jgi:hypothetical protein